MKKLIYAVVFALVISGCAAQTYKSARENANLVKNGMTVAEASQVLGMPPTHVIGDLVQWRRGNAQRYTGRPTGSIEFHVANGRIVDVPEGGIFSQAALDKIDRENAEQARVQALAEAERAKKEKLAQEARDAERERLKAERAKEVSAEMAAAEGSIVTCKDKVVCGKVFALAQIYVQQNADQKIQVATDTIIETYNPTDDGKVAISVIKIPRSGSTEVVKISPSCKDEKGYFEKSCRLKRTQIYSGFRPFIERSLSM